MQTDTSTLSRLSDLTAQQRDAFTCGDLMRFLATKAALRTTSTDVAAAHFLERWPTALHSATLRLQTKAAVLPGDVTNPAWAGALVGASAPSVDPLLAAIRRESLLGRIPGLRKVPFATPIPFQDGSANFAWWSPTTPKPVTKLPLGSVTFPSGTLAGIIVLTDELIKLAAPGGELAMQQRFVNDLVKAQDKFLLDPTIAEIADVRPASLTNGITPIAGTGNLAADVATLLAQFFTARPDAELPTLVMTAASASRLAATVPTVTVSGGFVNGVPVVPTPAAGAQVVALDAAAVAYADGGLALDISREAAIEMNDAPGAAGPTTVFTSFWQLNLAGFRLDRRLWWKALPNAVQVLTVTP